MSRHRLGGKSFESISESTVGHDLHFMKLMRESGLDEPVLESGETPEQFARKILGKLIKSGMALEMLGCLIIPKGARPEDWSPQMAKRTAKYLSGLTDPLDKAKVQSLILSLLVDFFETGLTSWMSSESSSGQSGTESKHRGPSEMIAMASGAS